MRQETSLFCTSLNIKITSANQGNKVFIKVFQNKMADQAGSEATQVLQFVPFSSAIEIGFWHKLTKNKLEKFKLDDSLKSLHGSFVNSKY